MDGQQLPDKTSHAAERTSCTYSQVPPVELGASALAEGQTWPSEKTLSKASQVSTSFIRAGTKCEHYAKEVRYAKIQN